MNRLTPFILNVLKANWLIALGLAILALHPILWLVNTWFDPAYDSMGLWIFLMAAALFLWSWRSPLKTSIATEKRGGLLLLLGSSGLRLVSQIMAVNIVGAMALSLDVYGLALMTGLKARERSISPFWLAVVFSFCLPITNVLQRTLGYLLQQFSALGTGWFLGLFYRVQVEGIRILLCGKDILVDLPCSGAQSATFLLLFFAILMAFHRPRLGQAVMGLLYTLLLAYVANTVRISILSIGVAFPNVVGHVNVMAQPWHDLIGLSTLLILGLLPILLWAGGMLPRYAITLKTEEAKPMPQNMPRARTSLARLKIWLACLFVACSMAIIAAPARPMDVSGVPKPVSFPTMLDGRLANRIPLTPQENAYYTKFGGQAIKLRYGLQSILYIQTTAPLRHLHAPSDCLRGAGYQVSYMGQDHQLLPSSVYRAVDRKGHAWRIAVTFYSSRGEFATSVSEAVWLWLKNPHTTWMALQRIAPADLPITANQAWDRVLFTALNLPVNRTQKIEKRISSHKTTEGEPYVCHFAKKSKKHFC